MTANDANDSNDATDSAGAAHGWSGEARAVARSQQPVTQVDVEAALRNVGLREGAVAIVHCSMSRLGWTVGGAPTIVHALRAAVGHTGTIVMPAQTGVSDPRHWQAPPVPETWWPIIRATWPAFDPQLTPLRGMGAVVECFTRLPDVVHSGHPAVGFVAHGPDAERLMQPHAVDAGFVDNSPLVRLYDIDADIVLIGVGHGNNTSLHLAEERALGADAPMVVDGAPLFVDGRRQWVEYTHVDHDDSDFDDLAAAFIGAGGVEQRSTLGVGEVRRVATRAIVDFGVDWLRQHRR